MCCRENLCDFEEILEILEYPDATEFFVMTRLDGAVLSASTFGIWVAYMGKFKITVVPDPLFTNKIYSESMCPAEWTRIPRTVN